MPHPTLHLIGAPIDCGKRRRGCVMGPDAFRTAGLHENLQDLGYEVKDRGNVVPADLDLADEGHLHALNAIVQWQKILSKTAYHAMHDSTPIFMGGDHAMSLGTIHGVAHYASEVGRPLFVLWLDAHTDYHTLHTTQSGNLHGTSLGYVTGRSGFDGFAPVPNPVPLSHVCLAGLRSVDPPERAALQASDAELLDMRAIDEFGLVSPLRRFLDRVKAQNGLLHVSLDVDFLDPDIAPAVGTTVPGGATFREAHLAMELVSEAGVLSSLDLAELNPFLDERGRTAQVIVDLVASAFGRRIFDRPTQAYT